MSLRTGSRGGLACVSGRLVVSFVDYFVDLLIPSMLLRKILLQWDSLLVCSTELGQRNFAEG